MALTFVRGSTEVCMIAGARNFPLTRGTSGTSVKITFIGVLTANSHNLLRSSVGRLGESVNVVHGVGGGNFSFSS